MLMTLLRRVLHPFTVVSKLITSGTGLSVTC
jgi:hypothetical protein